MVGQGVRHAWLLAGTLLACSAPATVDPALLEPLTALGPCSVEVTPTPIGDIAGLHLPPEAVVLSVGGEAPLVQIDGYVPLTPIEVRVHYQERSDVEILSIEDEIWESEALVTDGEHRLFVKAQAVCEQGSRFVAIVAPEAAAAAVPTPAGTSGSGGRR